jgi:hypothetical protein
MKRPAVIEVVRRAYHLREKAGKPEGRDQEFCHQAERELEAQSEDPETSPSEQTFAQSNSNGSRASETFVVPISCEINVSIAPARSRLSGC